MINSKFPMLSIAALLFVNVISCKKNSQEVEPSVQDRPKEKTNRPLYNVKGEIYKGARNQSKDYHLRVEEISRINPLSISSEDTEQLYALLDYKPSDADREHYWVVLNEVMAKLTQTESSISRFPNHLMSIIKDPNRHVVEREYAVQHIGHWVSPSSVSINPVDTETDTSPVIKTLVAVIKDPSLQSSTLPGTALGVLADNLKKENDVDKFFTDLSPWMSKVIQGKESSLAIRITAIGVSADLGLKENLADIQQLAFSDQTHPNVKLSSIAALGSLGTADDRERLRHIADGNTRFKYAAKAALDKFNKRINKKNNQ